MIEATHIERFECAIYITFVEINIYKDYKCVSKDKFYELLYNKVDKINSYQYDMSYRYRLADKKITWKDKYGRVLGLIYCEEDISSYWIKIS